MLRTGTIRGPLSWMQPHRLEHIYALANANEHLARLIAFGSFATAQPAPDDVDIFLLMEGSFGSR